MPATMLM